MLAQSFGERDNYSYAYDCYIGSKALGYDYWSYNQPDFDGSSPLDELVMPNLGEKIGVDMFQNTNGEWCRAYQYGMPCYNPTTGEGRIVWNKTATTDSMCFRVYDSDDVEGVYTAKFTITNSESGNVYNINLDTVANGQWATVCNTSISSDDYLEHGNYEIEMWYGDHTSGNGFNLAYAKSRGEGLNSWWDTFEPDSFTAYPEGQNWLGSINISSSTTEIVKEVSDINQTLVDFDFHSNTISISSVDDYLMNVKLFNINLLNLYSLVYNGTTLTYNSTGIENNVSGEIHTISYDGTTLSITTPHLSNQTYNATLNSIPVITQVVLSNLHLDEITSLDYVYSDSDGDSISANITKWYIDGTYNSSYDNQTTFNNSLLSAGTVLIAQLMIYDGYNWSEALNSSQFTLINNEPVTSSVTIHDCADGLNPFVTYLYSDTDEDDEFMNITTWTLNENTTISNRSLLNVITDNIIEGTTLFVTIKVSDGYSWSNLANASCTYAFYSGSVIDYDLLQGLPSIGTNIGNFLKNFAPGIGTFLIIIAIFSGIAAIVYTVVYIIRNKIKT